MAIWFIGRMMQACLVVIAMTVIVFIGVYAIGNPVDILISPEATADDRARAIAALGLDQPLWRQYLTFLVNALHGDLGRSFVYNEPALKVILERMPATLELAFFAILIAAAIGLPAGIYAGLHPQSSFSRGLMTASILGFSLPSFWIGLMMILLFSVQLGWLPSSGRGATREILGIHTSLLTLDGWRHLILPGINLALFNLSMVMRLVRAGVREIMPMDYIKFARAKGLTRSRIIGVHVMKNILAPVITVVGLEFGTTVAFSVVTETIFSWPGMGKLVIDSINVLDRPVLVAYLVIVVLMFVTINLIVDLLYTALDPRVRIVEAA